jgi:hypothetical protein
VSWWNEAWVRHVILKSSKEAALALEGKNKDKWRFCARSLKNVYVKEGVNILALKMVWGWKHSNSYFYITEVGGFYINQEVSHSAL